MKLNKLDASFGREIIGVSLAEVDDELFEEIYKLWLEHGLLIFPQQHLKKEQQVAFAQRFGDLELEYTWVSNVKPDGTIREPEKNDDVIKILKGNFGWHADSTYLPVQSKGAVFSALVVPSEGGETGWADMRSAYAALDSDMKERIKRLSAYHSLYYSQGKLGHQPSAESDYSGYGFTDSEPPLRPLVHDHPETGIPNLIIGRHAYGIPGMNEEESEHLLSDLLEFACQKERSYHHNWQVGDVAVWDNRCLLHQARPWNMHEARTMCQSRIAGDPATDSARTVSL